LKAVSILLILLSFTSRAQQVVQLCPGEETFTYYSSSYYYGSWEWMLDNQNISNSNSVTITWDSIGTYTLIVRFNSGCQTERSYSIEVIDCPVYFPNTFTPNGDGLNDSWKPYINSDQIRWYIYDRWGLEIYTADDKEDSWDGCMDYNGERRPCQSDVYIWLAEWKYLKGGWQSKTGRVTIAR
jgi:gliding motility-associated-like protein